MALRVTQPKGLSFRNYWISLQLLQFRLLWPQKVFFFSSNFLFLTIFRDLHLKMLLGWQSKERWMFIQFMLPLSLDLIQASLLTEYWKCPRLGKQVLYRKVLLNFLLEFFLLLITLQNAWQLERHGCNRLQSSPQM